MYTLYIHKNGKVFQYGDDCREWSLVEKDILFLTEIGRYDHSNIEARLC